MRRVFSATALALLLAGVCAMALGRAAGTAGGQVVVHRGEPVQIAVVLDHSGGLAASGLSSRNAVQMAVDRHPSIRGFPVQLNDFDGPCHAPDVAAAVAAQVVANPANVAVIGHMCSLDEHAALPIYEEAGVVAISGSATGLRNPDFGPDVFNSVDVPDDTPGESDAWYAQVQQLPRDIAWRATYTVKFGAAPEAFADLYFDAASLALNEIAAASTLSKGDLVIDRAILAADVRSVAGASALGYRGVTCWIQLDARGYRINDPAAFDRCGRITVNTTLTEDQFGPITIAGDGVMLDCAGHNIIGPGFVGVYLPNRTGVTVRNCQISGFGRDIFLEGGSGNSLLGNTLWNTDEDIRLEASSNNQVSGNTATGSRCHGIAIYAGSSGNAFTQNTSNGNFCYGFVAVDSGGNTYMGNVAIGDEEGLVGVNSDNNAYTGNTVRNSVHNGFHLYNGSTGNTLAGNTSDSNLNGFRLDGASSNTLRDNVASNSFGHGIWLADGSSGNTVRHNTASANTIGIVASSASGNTFTQNTASGNRDDGIVVVDGSDALSGNTASGNAHNGFHLSGGSSGVSVIGNTAEGNQNGFWLDDAHDNTLSGNTARTNREHGFGVASESVGNTLAGNTADGNGAIGFVTFADGNALRGNRAVSNGAGFAILSNNTEVRGNSAVQNRNDGFSVANGGANNTLAGNGSRNNGGQGFALYSAGTGNVLSENMAMGDAFGFLAADTRSGRMLLNIATDNRYNGFTVNNGGGFTLTGNSAIGNAGTGFMQALTESNVLTGNQSDGNGRDGFELDRATGNGISHNTAIHNAQVGFHVELGSTGNRLDANVGRQNGFRDAQDDNPPGANQWTNNTFGVAAIP